MDTLFWKLFPDLSVPIIAEEQLAILQARQLGFQIEDLAEPYFTIGIAELGLSLTTEGDKP